VLQTIALLAMEPPISLDGEDIRNEKVHIQIINSITFLVTCLKQLTENLDNLDSSYRNLAQLLKHN
jgi:glucose-6-phosphate 1-dehydrogenase